jgi:hypothetical protein
MGKSLLIKSCLLEEERRRATARRQEAGSSEAERAKRTRDNGDHCYAFGNLTQYLVSTRPVL